MPTVPDHSFLSPTEVNIHECVSASRFLQKSNDILDIVSVCQDPNNINLVVVTFSLVGTFLYLPCLKILDVDGDTSYGTNNVVAPIAVGYPTNVAIPIDTNCQTLHASIAFDFGQVIANYRSARTITFMLQMNGTIPQSYGVSFPNQSAEVDFTWNKGLLPQPINITYTTNGYVSVTFGYNGDVDCSCNISCVIPSGLSQDLVFCPGQAQTVLLYNGNNQEDIYRILINLTDSLGNESSIDYNSYIYSTPQSPTTIVGIKPKRIDVSLRRITTNGTEIPSDVEYQILKYHGSEQNTKVWKDWSKHSWDFFVDYDIVPGESYGYAVRFKGRYGDVSNRSEWSVVTYDV